MSNTKHTPGPWIAADRLTGGSIEVTPATNPNMQVARVNGHAGEQEANARLIAAAPELLSALRYMLANGEADGWSDMMLSDARTAIAKATGEGT